MGEKVPVVVMVDPEVETIIKPFAGQIAKSISFDEKSTAQPSNVTGSGTVTYSDGKWDGDGTIDS